MGAAAVLLVTLVGSVAASDITGVCENWYVHPSQPCVSFCQEAVQSDSRQRLPLGVALFPGDLLAFLARRHPLPFIRLPARQTRRTSHLTSTPDKHTRAWHCPLRSIPCASRGRGGALPAELAPMMHLEPPHSRLMDGPWPCNMRGAERARPARRTS